MATRIGKTYRFEAAHHLPEHDGKCRNPHGHSYVVEVEFVGELHDSGPKSGMVHDYGDISAFWKKELEPLLDHRDLNESLADMVEPTTAENLAAWIYFRFAAQGMPPDLVRVHETATSMAQYPA